MRYRALATDYDGTIARGGRVEEATIEALGRWKRSGRGLILATGRALGELKGVFPALGLFDLVVAENGGLLYRPADGSVRLLAEGPSEELVETLKRKGVAPLAVGQVVLATTENWQGLVKEAIRDVRLDDTLDVILNKGSVMVLPSGVDKWTGLVEALGEMGLLKEAVVAVGDAENDVTMLEGCGLGVAVGNALAMVKARAGRVTLGERGAGVAELIDGLLGADV